jgi:drug/metabolite transporter (DMT)-like permease
MALYLGEIAALITSACFSATSSFFTLAGRRVGSLVVNRTRLILALLFLIPTHWVMLGHPLPLMLEPSRWVWLGLSGVVGLVLGDIFLFQAFVLIGPRLSMLMMSLAPILAALMAWFFLDERLLIGQIFGIVLTLAGIAWVILERNGAAREDRDRQDYLLGIFYGFGGATGQALGLILAKLGLEGDFSPIAANIIRMAAATITLWTFTIIRGQAKPTFRKLGADSRAVWYILIGAFTGPFLGVSFSLLALQRAQVGVASTLMALPPVILLPVSYLVFKERYGWQAVAGTLLAIAGVAMLFLV